MELNTFGAMVLGGIAAGIGSLVARLRRRGKRPGPEAGTDEQTIVTFGRRSTAKSLKDVRRQVDP